MSGRAESDFDGATVGILMLLGVPALVAYLKTPQAFGFLIGGLLAAIPIAAGSVDADPERWRGTAVRTILAGVLTATSFVFLKGLIGVDAQMRQFGRAWEGSWPRDLRVLADYP